jgi:hypothetical protein
MLTVIIKELATIFVILFLAFIIWQGISFTHFAYLKHKQEAKERAKDNALGCHAGGVLFVQGGKTYYNMPNGVRRKIADYEMDLNPASPDMRQFTECMETARREHNAEERVKRVNAKREMVKVAKEVAHE